MQRFLINGNLDLHFQGEMINIFVAGHDAVVVVEMLLKLFQGRDISNIVKRYPYYNPDP